MNLMPAKIKYLTYFAIGFGALTIFSGGQNLFNANVIRTQGNIIPVVLWFNFMAGFLYILTGLCVLKRKKIALPLAKTIINIVDGKKKPDVAMQDFFQKM